MGLQTALFVTLMAENVAELERKLSAFQKEANLLRARRDDLNARARAHADRRDEFNAQVRQFVNEANEHKKRRDALNEQVQNMKKLRDELNGAAEEAQRALDELKRAKLPRQGRSISHLKREIKRIEYEHMTKALTPAKEKALIEELQKLHREIREKEAVMEGDAELKAAYDAALQAKERAERQHEKVGELAQRAQGEHESMVKLFEESDRVRKTADATQQQFVEAKTDADRVHRQYVELVEQIHALESDQRAQSPGGGGTTVQEDQAAATEIFERFKRGEKLSTQDLMTLQKAGLL